MSLLNINADLFTPRLIDNLRDIPYAVFEHLLSPQSVLRPKQREATEYTAHKIFEEYLRAIALIMPTSTGKTVILAQMIAALQQDELIGHKPKRVMIVTDTVEGILQTQDKLKAYANIDCGLYYKDQKDLNNPITVTTYHSWQNKNFPFNLEDIDIVILDEAHEAISDARLAKLKQHTNAIWFALTASPTYSQERSVLNHFALGYRMTMEEAVEHRLVSSLRNVVLNSNIEVDLTEVKLRGKDFDPKALAKVVNTEARNQIGAEYLLFGRHPDTGQPIREIPGITSCINLKHAESFANQTNALHNHYFSGKNFKHGFIRFVGGSSKDRRDLLNWHRDGDIQHLAYADLLNQNYDDYRIGVVLNLRPAKSYVLVTQRGGRSGRLDLFNPGKISLVTDINDKYKNIPNKKPLFYSHAIGSSAIITDEAKFIAQKQLMTTKYDLMDRSQIPEIEKIIKKIELNIITEEEIIFSLSGPQEELRDRTEDDLSNLDLQGIYGISQPPLTTAFKRLLEDWRLHRNEPEKYPQPTVPYEFVGTKTGSGGGRLSTLTITREYVDAFKNEYLPIADLSLAEDDDLVVADIEKIIGVGQPSISQALNKLKSAWNIHLKNPDKQPKPTIAINLIKGANGRATISIKKSQLEAFKQVYLKYTCLRKKTENDLSVLEVKKEIGFSRDAIRRQFNKIKAENEAHRLDPNKYPKPKIEVEAVWADRGVADTIPKSQLEFFKLNYLSKKSSKQDYYTTREVSEKTGLTLWTIEKSFKSNIDAQKAHKKDSKNFSLPQILVKEVSFPGETPKFRVIKKDDYEPYKKLFLQEAIKNSIVPKATIKDLVLNRLMKATHNPEAKILFALRQLKADWEEFSNAPEDKIEPPVKLNYVFYKSKVAASIDAEDLDKFTEKYLPENRFNIISENQLKAQEVADLCGIGHKLANDGFNQCHTKKEHGGIEESIVNIQRVRVKNYKPLVIFAEEVPQFIQHYIPKVYNKFIQNQDSIMKSVQEYVQTKKLNSKSNFNNEN